MFPAINWGLVSGKTGTIWRWSSRSVQIDGQKMTPETMRARGLVVKPGEKFPEPDKYKWHHDFFRMDGTPFDQKEVDFIKRVTGAEKK